MSKKTILITGSTSGLGKALTERLATRENLHLLLHGRNLMLLEELATAVSSTPNNTTADIVSADLSDLDQVHELAHKVTGNCDQLHVLINNAAAGPGAKGAPRERNVQGIELRLAVNYLAPFLLNRLLTPLLRSTPGARIVNIASAGQQPLDFANLELERDYEGWRAYMQSKTALLMDTIDLAKELEEEVTVNANHPGTFMDTGMVRTAGAAPRTPLSQGVEATLFLAEDDSVAQTTGCYFNQKEPARAIDQVYDPTARQQLHSWAHQRLGGLLQKEPV